MRASRGMVDELACTWLNYSPDNREDANFLVCLYNKNSAFKRKVRRKLSKAWGKPLSKFSVEEAAEMMGRIRAHAYIREVTKVQEEESS